MFNVVDGKKAVQSLYGYDASVKRLPGEYDYNFYIKTDDSKEFILKISHHNEDRAIVAMQNELLLKLQTSLFPFHSPVLQRTLNGNLVGELVDHEERPHLVRLFSFIPGSLLAHVPVHKNILLASLGRQLGHLSLALKDFRHSAAQRYLKWDLNHAGWIRDRVEVIANKEDRQVVTHFFEKYEQNCLPVLPLLRQSIIHGDINDYNVLVCGEDPETMQVSGFIDYGDMVLTATINELAIAVTYAIMNKPDPLDAASQIIKAYHEVFPLTLSEIDILFDLIGVRLCVSVTNSAIQKKERPDDTYLVISEKSAWTLLKKLRGIDGLFARNTFRRASGWDCVKNKWNKAEILNKRQRLIGKNVGLTYDTPLLIVRGFGTYLYDENGRQYLDCVNNVCHVGHCHPKVVSAGQQQMQLLNTNTRYLHDYLIEYAERMIATLPPELEVCFFVNSGSEANELALRLAQTHTNRRKLLVMDHGYHGNTSMLINISPYKFNGPGGHGKPDFVQILPLPRDEKNQELREVNQPIAAFICESIPGCAGQVILPNNYLQSVYSLVRQTGGLCIADEVQTGLGRVGTHFWGFETQGVIPDIVTMGKPLGNGHPLGAVITTREIAESFHNGMEYFNSFGGNPVSCAIGLSVLDVIEEEKLQERANETGNYLKEKLKSLQCKYPVIRDVRGAGLFLGVELTDDKFPLESSTALTKLVINQMKERGVLLSADGPYHNVIKIKPPLVFTKENGDYLTSHLDEVLSSF